MALWGKDDNLETHPLTQTVSLATTNFTTRIITGAGTSFGTTGFGVVGDIIRFGIRKSRGGGNTGVYYGDAIIEEVISATQVKIASTESLAGSEANGANVNVASTSFYLSELPKQTTWDHEFSDTRDNTGSYKAYKNKEATAATIVGGDILGIDKYHTLKLQIDKTHPDVLVNGVNEIRVAGLGTGVVDAATGSTVGFSTLFVAAVPDAIKVGQSVGNLNAAGQKIKITSIAGTTIGLGDTIATKIEAGEAIVFHSPHIVSLASTIGTAVASGDVLHFKRFSGGYDRLVYGISPTTVGHYESSSGKYRLENAGWVGVTTYIDCHGEFRVKKETLVAIGGNVGITTGDYGIKYPTPAAN